MLKKLLSDSEKKFNKQQELLVRNLNDDFKKNPNKVLNNPRLINLLNLKLENGNIVSKNKTKKQILESINRQGGLLDIEHISDIATGKKNVQFPVNRQITTYNVNSGFLRSVANYLNKPNADPDKIANIEKTLKEYGLRVSTNKGTIGAPMISASDNVIRNLKNAGIETSSRLPKLGKVAPVVGAILGGTGAAQAGPLSAEEAVAAEGAPAPLSLTPIDTPVAAGAGALALGTKKGQNILGRTIGGAFGPTGLFLLGAGTGGYDLTNPLGRSTLAAEAAFAPDFVRGTIGATKGMKNRALQKVTQRALNLGLSVPQALRVARIASPLGIAALGGEALYGYGKFVKSELDRIKEMTPEEREQYNAAEQEQMGIAAAGGGLLKQAGDRSGKPPEAGPLPQGLAYLLKRGSKS